MQRLIVIVMGLLLSTTAFAHGNEVALVVPVLLVLGGGLFWLGLSVSGAGSLILRLVGGLAFAWGLLIGAVALYSALSDDAARKADRPPVGKQELLS